MGSYLSEPVTEKISSEDASELFACGASSMQGWRISQEDAHNCILDFDTNTSFFAVYDGHGGHEVALYCSQHLPAFLKTLDAYKQADIEKALEEAFLSFDATIIKPDVIQVLKEMAKDREVEDSDEDEENVNHLYEEATMPIEKVIEKYTNKLLKPKQQQDEKQPYSPMLKAKKNVSDTAAGGSGTSKEEKSKEEPTETASETKEDVKENGNVEESAKATIDKPTDEPAAELKESESAPPAQNGSTPKKGKALTKTKGVVIPEATEEAKNTRPKRTIQQIYAKLLDMDNAEEESDNDDDDDVEDKTFEEPKKEAHSSDEDGDDANNLEDILSSEDSDDDDDEEEEEDIEEEDEDEDEVATTSFANSMVEEPGSDSGCTAVVALLKDDKLYVANAGDSRCIVCRNGQAVDMSFDHKPEDQPERDRIVKAGGRVTADGRVNGGLNLSRAIGDHAYKQNKELSDREQMIIALPDIKTLDIDSTTDEFMVLACDGIWNYMSSQEVVAFVRPLIKSGVSLSKICEDLFDHCLAPNTLGDGTGCDNMTAIIIKFKAWKDGKRGASADPETETNDAKRVKTDDDAKATEIETAVDT